MADQGSPEPNEEPVFWGYKDLAIFLSLFLPALMIGFLVTGAALKLSPAATPRAMQALPPQFIAYGLWFFGLSVVLKPYGRSFAEAIGWVKPARPLWTYTGYGIVLVASVMGLLAVTPPPQAETPMKQLFDGPVSTILLGIFAVTLGPVCEEWAFRGFVQPLFCKTFGVAAGIVLTSLPFALMHGQEYAWSWNYILGLVIASAGFGYVRHISGSTKASTVTHGTYNLVFFVLYLLQNRYLLNG